MTIFLCDNVKNCITINICNFLNNIMVRNKSKIYFLNLILLNDQEIINNKKIKFKMKKIV